MFLTSIFSKSVTQYKDYLQNFSHLFYDDANNIDSITDLTGGTVIIYGYNKLNQLESMTASIRIMFAVRITVQFQVAMRE